MNQENLKGHRETAGHHVDQALWIKSMTLSRGNRDEAKKRYLKLSGTNSHENPVPMEDRENPAEKKSDESKTPKKESAMLNLFRRLDLLITLLFFSLFLVAERYEIMPWLENPLIGYRSLLRVETLPSEQTEFPYDDIVIIDTEEDFFEEYGSWPLKRKDIAKMVVNLKRLGA